MMYGAIQKWGNSQGLRIPKGALQMTQLKEGDTVEIIADNNQLVIRKARGYQSLDALFEGYSGEYRCSEADTGEPVGREVLE